ncbi:mitochondrial ribosomal subunit protein-domain-containing protein, partial [Catenaria anguillulae PL171]
MSTPAALLRPFASASAVAASSGRRALHTSTLHLARKAQSSQSFATTGHPEMDRMNEEMDPSLFKTYRGDGMSAYQMQLVTTAVLVRSYLEKAHNELPHLRAALKPEPYSPPSKRAYLRFRYVDHPSDQTNPMDRKVTLYVKVSEVAAAEKLSKDQEHALKLLAGPRFDPIDKVITMANDRFMYRAQNKAWLADTFAELLKQAKELKVPVADLPVDTRHVAKKAKALARKERVKFPKEWLIRPTVASAEKVAAAPVVEAAAAAQHRPLHRHLP